MNIPDKAVDAAVDAMVTSSLGDHRGISGEDLVEAARAALEAAAPHMLALAVPTNSEIASEQVRDAELYWAGLNIVGQGQVAP